MALAGLVAAITTVLPVAPASAETACTPTGGRTACIQFDYTGADQSFRVPNGVTEIVASVYGGQGGTSAVPLAGGLGAVASGTIATAPGTIYTVSVGAHGDVGTYGGGGIAGAGSRERGGNGGGLSALWSGASFVAAHALLVAGGGGGSSGPAAGPNWGRGGGGGGPAGGWAGTATGGTQTEGGVAALLAANSVEGSAGTQFRGGDSAAALDSGGGGGGGWFGGGAGLGQVDLVGADSDTSGGGGSGYLSPLVSGGSMTSWAHAGPGLVVIEFVTPQTVITSPTSGTIQGSFVLTGTGTPGNTLTATIPGSPACTTTVAPEGTWTCGTIARAPGTVTITTVETDPASPLAGYPGAAVTVTVAPSAPEVDPTAGVTVTGTADAGTTVAVRDSSGTLLGTGIAAPDGSFTVALSSAQPHGSVLSVTATEGASNTSPVATVVVDAAAPAAPVLDPSGGLTVSGTAEPGSHVVIRDPSGTVLGSGTADASGAFTIVLNPAQNDGVVLSATATDDLGNVSPASTVTVHVPPPSPPTDIVCVENPSRTVTCSGGGEPGVEVEVRDSGDGPVCMVVVAADGSWSCTSTGPVERRPLSITVTAPRGSTTAVDDVPVRSRATGLASTGIPVLDLAVVGAALSALGVAVFAIRRRRRVSARRP